MGILNRLFLLPYALFTMALSIAVAAVALRIIPEGVWLNELRYALSRQELLAVCAIAFLVSLKLFFAVFSRTSNPSSRTHGEFMVIDTPAGAVQVAVVSVHDMRKDSAAAPMQVELKITLADRTNLNAITEELTQNVRRNLQDVLGISDIPVIIRVAEISNASQSKRSIA